MNEIQAKNEMKNLLDKRLSVIPDRIRDRIFENIIGEHIEAELRGTDMEDFEDHVEDIVDEEPESIRHLRRYL